MIKKHGTFFASLFATLILFSTIFSVVSLRVNAVEDCQDGDIDCVNRKIDEYKKKIGELQGEQQTLSSAISYLDNKIRLTESEIRKTEIEIAQLEKEIAALSVRIEGLELSLKRLTELLISRVQKSYKQKSQDPMLLLFSSNEFGDFYAKYKYMQRSQEYTQKLMNEAEEQKVDYGNQKKSKEEKQAEVEALKKKHQAQKNSLNQQKSQKQSLLTATKNDEAKYQSLLQQALAEKNALEAALVSGVKVGPVKKGDPIALVGNSGYPGCSTGEHLHFEVRKNNSWVDPGGYLSSKTVNDEEKGGTSTLGSGSWDWPLQETIRLTQHYGRTPYSWRYSYSGGIHTGYDMVSTSSKVIRAPADGTLYSSSQSCGSSSTINIKYIEHGDGVISFYLHVQ